MALTDKELQELIDSLSTEELEQLQTQLKAKESSEEQENHNEFEIKRGAEAIALMGTVAVTVNELIANSKLSASAAVLTKSQ